MKEKNKGVYCSVNDCTHNMRGCECDMEKIEIATDNIGRRHFCKSFANKD